MAGKVAKTKDHKKKSVSFAVGLGMFAASLGRSLAVQPKRKKPKR